MIRPSTTDPTSGVQPEIISEISEALEHEAIDGHFDLYEDPVAPEPDLYEDQVAPEPPTLLDLMEEMACMQRNIASLSRLLSDLAAQLRTTHDRTIRIQDAVVMLVVQQQQSSEQQQNQNQDEQQQ